MLKRAGKRKFGEVTWDGRLVVDVDQLYRSKQVQRVMQRLDGPGNNKIDPLAELWPLRSLRSQKG